MRRLRLAQEAGDGVNRLTKYRLGASRRQGIGPKQAQEMSVGRIGWQNGPRDADFREGAASLQSPIPA